MDRGKFEDKVRRKFEGQTKKTPEGIWENINNSLNADLVSIYASQQVIYKWISIAAVLLVVILLGILYLPSTLIKEQNQLASYNALLSNDIDFNSYYSHNFSGFQKMDLGFQPEERAKTTSNTQLIDTKEGEDYTKIYTEFKLITGRRPSMLVAQVSGDIYPYHSGVILASRKSKGDAEKKVWAGVEAGAGTFNADFGGSGTLANSLNPLGLAAAVGSGSFVNPTTNVSQNMNEAIATTIGFDFGVEFGKKWTLESGLAYTSVENNGRASINVIDIYSIDNSSLVDQDVNGVNGGEVINPGISSREGATEIEENFDHEVELNNNIQFASIPIKAGYFIVNNRFSMRVNAGLSANYLMDGSISDPSRKIVNSGDIGIYNDWSFDGIGGLELGYSIFEKFDVTIEPNYRHSITPISSSANSPSRILIQTGLRYTLK